MVKDYFKKVLHHFGLDLRRFSDSHMTPVTSEWMGTFYYFLKRYQEIKNIDGDIVECGVGRGRTFLFFAFFLSEDPKARMLWGFDSFEGFPEPALQDKSSRNPYKGERNNTTIEYVLWLLKDSGISKEVIDTKIRLVKGFFDKSLSSYSGEKIALLHLDGDLYESYRDPLALLYPKVAKGGLILFDEYDDPAFPGARKAIDEYFTKIGVTPIVHFDALSGTHYMVKP